MTKNIFVKLISNGDNLITMAYTESMVLLDHLNRILSQHQHFLYFSTIILYRTHMQINKSYILVNFNQICAAYYN